VQPLTVGRLAHHWDREPAFVAGTPAKVRSLELNIESFFELCEVADTNVKAQSFDASGRHVETAIRGNDARAHYAAGSTICFSAMNRFDRRLEACVDEAQRSLGLTGDADINGYLSPAGAGFGLHFDDHPVMIVQIAGSKRWYFSAAPVVDAPTCNIVAGHESEIIYRRAYSWFSTPFPDNSELRQALLTPGDLLFLPAGTAHRTEAGSHSLAITIAWRSRVFADLLSSLLNESMIGHAAWRRRLPPLLSPDAGPTNEAMSRLVAVQLTQVRDWLSAIEPSAFVDRWRRGCR
jgi:ribosomal protein L16 Arg81 hydroxylase